MNGASSRLGTIVIPVVAVLVGVLFALILAHTVGAWAWFLVSAGLVILLVVATVKVMRRRRALLYAPDDGLDR
jgi:F0F1-type ATP synthase assembly protein I